MAEAMRYMKNRNTTRVLVWDQKLVDSRPNKYVECTLSGNRVGTGENVVIPSQEEVEAFLAKTGQRLITPDPEPTLEVNPAIAPATDELNNVVFPSDTELNGMAKPRLLNWARGIPGLRALLFDVMTKAEMLEIVFNAKKRFLKLQEMNQDDNGESNISGNIG